MYSSKTPCNTFLCLSLSYSYFIHDLFLVFFFLRLCFRIAFFNDVKRSVADIVVYSGYVLPYYAYGYELHAAYEQHAQYERGPTGDGVIETEVRHQGIDKGKQRNDCRKDTQAGSYLQWLVRKCRYAVEGKA